MAVAAGVDLPAGYEIAARREVPWLRSTITELVHEPTGLRHVHLACPSEESFFAVGFRTHAPDFSGLPHIMEHCRSGGSRHLPVGAGAPIYKRSLLSTINATTWLSHTDFYCGSANPRDVLNFATYILDIAFFATLPHDAFLRHRGRHEPSVPGDPRSPLRYTGVIYNEMKAVFADPMKHASNVLHRALFPGHPYAWDTGGDPLFVPRLDYSDFLAFSARHYHPNNALVVSYGEIPLAHVAGLVEEKVLRRWDAPKRPPSRVPDPPPVRGPLLASGPFPVGEADAGSGQLLAGWVGPSGADSAARLAMRALAAAVFDEPEAPVRLALRRSGLADGMVRAWAAPDQRTMAVLHVTGVAPESGAAADAVVRDRLGEVAAAGLDRGAVSAVLDRFELERRDPAAGRAEFIRAAWAAFEHGGDVVRSIEFAEDLAVVRAQLESGELDAFFREHIAANACSATAVMVPDPGLEARVRLEEEARLAAMDAAITGAARADLAAAQERVMAPPPPLDRASLPGLRLGDDLGEIRVPTLAEVAAPFPLHVAEMPVNGLAYAEVRFRLDDLSTEGGALAAVLGRALASATGARWAVDARSTVDGSAAAWLRLTWRGRAGDDEALRRFVAALTGVPGAEAVAAALGALRGEVESGLMQSAQEQMRRFAAARLLRSAAVEDGAYGIGRLRALRAAAALPASELAARVAALQAAVAGRARAGALVTAEPEHSARLVAVLAEAASAWPAGAVIPAADDAVQPPPAPFHTGVLAPFPVAFNTQAFRLPAEPAAAGVASVLGQLMQQGTLTREISRKGAAYGIDVESFPERGILWMGARRDPFVGASHRAVDLAFAEVLGEITAEDLEDAQFGALRQAEPPQAPDASALRAWSGLATGHGAAWRRTYRDAIAAATAEQVRDAARALRGSGVRVTIAGPGLLDAERGSGLFDSIEEL